MSSEIKTSSLDFGTVIAFVAPGFIGLYALSYHVLTARTWLDAASNKEQSVGVFLMVLLASIAIGLVISGVRQLVIDNLLCSSRLGRFALPQHALDWSKITEKNLPLLNTIRDGYYWYYHFYSNTLVSVVFWAAARWTAGVSFRWWHWMVIAFAAIGLLSSARFSLQRYRSALSQAFK
jgi:hypothetical protein